MTTVSNEDVIQKAQELSALLATHNLLEAVRAVAWYSIEEDDGDKEYVDAFHHMQTMLHEFDELAKRAENPKPVSKSTFDRWKYAEEHAKKLIERGRLVRLTMTPNVTHTDEDDEEYVYDDFHVEDLGPR